MVPFGDGVLVTMDTVIGCETCEELFTGRRLVTGGGEEGREGGREGEGGDGRGGEGRGRLGEREGGREGKKRRLGVGVWAMDTDCSYTPYLH